MSLSDELAEITDRVQAAHRRKHIEETRRAALSGLVTRLESVASEGKRSMGVYQFYADKHWWYTRPSESNWKTDLAAEVVEALQAEGVKSELQHRSTVLGHEWTVVAVW